MMHEHMNAPRHAARDIARGEWLIALRRYLCFTAIANLLWEFAQLPLYTIWTEGAIREIVFAAIHCTSGDVIIASVSLMLALLMTGANWPLESRTYHRVAALTLTFGILFTLFSEWLNVVVRKSWAYSELMPIIPVLNAGLSPVLQWIVIPLAAFGWARRPFALGGSSKESRS